MKKKELSNGVEGLLIGQIFFLSNGKTQFMCRILPSPIFIAPIEVFLNPWSLDRSPAESHESAL